MEIEASRKTAKEFKASRLDDLECFSKTLDRIETDLDNMKLRANAWAMGDLECCVPCPTKTSTPPARRPSGAAVFRDVGDLKARVKAAWLEAAAKTLDEYPTSFAVLRMLQVVASDGYLAALRERGMLVQAPG